MRTASPQASACAPRAPLPHPYIDRPRPGIAGGHLDAESAARQVRADVCTRELVQVEHVVGAGGRQVVAHGRQQAHDVRRAAGAGEPLPAAPGIVALVVTLAALQRVDVEEPLPADGDRPAWAVVDEALAV